MKFIYNDLAKVKENAPKNLRPGEFASIEGITVIDNKELSLDVNLPIGTIAFTIEYDDGTDNLVPEDFLDKYFENK